MRYKMCFDILNRSEIAHECDGQTDGQNRRTLALATARSNGTR